MGINESKRKDESTSASASASASAHAFDASDTNPRRRMSGKESKRRGWRRSGHGRAPPLTRLTDADVDGEKDVDLKAVVIDEISELMEKDYVDGKEEDLTSKDDSIRKSREMEIRRLRQSDREDERRWRKEEIECKKEEEEEEEEEEEVEEKEEDEEEADDNDNNQRINRLSNRRLRGKHGIAHAHHVTNATAVKDVKHSKHASRATHATRGNRAHDAAHANGAKDFTKLNSAAHTNQDVNLKVGPLPTVKNDAAVKYEKRWSPSAPRGVDGTKDVSAPLASRRLEKRRESAPLFLSAPSKNINAPPQKTASSSAPQSRNRRRRKRATVIEGDSDTDSEFSTERDRESLDDQDKEGASVDEPSPSRPSSRKRASTRVPSPSIFEEDEEMRRGYLDAHLYQTVLMFDKEVLEKIKENRYYWIYPNQMRSLPSYKLAGYVHQ